MARPLRIQYPGAYYHVTCRGNEKKPIFIDSQDREVFLEKLVISLDIYNVSLLAYVCMPNHFHLLLITPEGNLSEFMRHFNISYTSAFNWRHNRVGHLYQGRYKSFLIDADNYLLEVSRYIHLNPVRTEEFLKKTARERWKILLQYKGSSLLGYLLAGKKKEFVNYRTVLGYMGGENTRGRQAYRRFITQGIKGEIEDPLVIGKGHGIVGEPAFIKWVKEGLSDKKSSSREQPAAKILRKVCEPKELIEHFMRLIGKSRKEFCQRGKKSIERAMLMELLYRLCPIKQPEIGKLVGGIDYSAVSQARKRLRKKLEEDPELKKKFEYICDQLAQVSRRKI